MSSNICLVIGDAQCKDADLTEALSLVDEFDVCCVNKAGLWYPGDFEHWFSWHANILAEEWSPQRVGPRLHSTYEYPGIELHKVSCPYGGSGLQAILTMLECLEYDKVLLVGMPMNGDYWKFLEQWSINGHRDKIRSMSGETKRKYGYPDKGWLNV